MSKIVIITPQIKKEGEIISKEIEDYVKKRGYEAETVFIESTEGTMELDSSVVLLIALGGDGTVLYCARAAAKLNITVLPINLGTFGYITEIEKSEWKDALDLYLNGVKNYSNRLMLSVSVYRKNRKVFQSFALNEAVISSSGIAKVINLTLSIDNTFAGNFRSDGMIVATPTGSTGYSLASGGPILDADMRALIITPICPFALSNRPLVTGDKLVVLDIKKDQRTDIVLTVDGQVFFVLNELDRVVVKMSNKRLKLIHSSKRNFTEVIREKLHWSGEMKHD